jgi:hypothetical protein
VQDSLKCLHDSTGFVFNLAAESSFVAYLNILQVHIYGLFYDSYLVGQFGGLCLMGLILG